MTKTTAKKGMLEVKVGYGKEEFGFRFLEDIQFNSETDVKDLIVLFKKSVKDLKDAIAEQEKTHKEELQRLENLVNERLQKFDKAFEKNIKEWLTR